MATDGQRRRREGSQRAQAARTRRVEARRGRQSRGVFYAVGAVLAIIVATAAFFVFREDSPTVGIRVSVPPTAAHSPPYAYNTSIVIDGTQILIPPSGGNHFPQWSSYGFQGELLVPEAAVHNLEHGGIVVWYQPGRPALAGQINGLIRELGIQCLVAGEYALMDFEAAATAWGWVLPMPTYNEFLLRDFIDEFRGKEGPEAPICQQGQ